MRRFEFVAGTSSKFWMAEVSGSTFVVVFGRIGTDGQRKEKDFPSEDAARRELEKKIAEKLREGYSEVGAGASSAAPAASTTGAAPAKAPKAAVAAAPRPPLPPRVVRIAPTPESVKNATEALSALRKTLVGKHRSWQIAQLAGRARRALEAIAGADPAAHRELAPVFDELMAQVLASRGARLPLRLALPLLLELDVAAFTRVLASWQKADKPHPAAAAAVRVLADQLQALDDPELTLRLGALLCARPDRDTSPEPAWTRKWRALQPHLEAQLATRGTTLKAHVQQLSAQDALATAQLADRVQRLR